MNTMLKAIEAIYANGAFQPVDALDLADQQRVRLTVEVIPDDNGRARADAFRRVRERIARSSFSYGGPMPGRDELHERL
jgi:predicted DNA-binding antitoxin AbrB/MazE fold protein